MNEYCLSQKNHQKLNIILNYTISIRYMMRKVELMLKILSNLVIIYINNNDQVIG
jgi:hypothetical protein